jgi:holin (3TMs family)
MGFPLLGFLTGPLKGIIDGVGGVIDNLTTTDKEKLEAKAQLLVIERQFNAALLQADTEFAKTQAEVIMTESKSEHFLTSTWRPILMLTFTFIIAWNYIFVPILGAFTDKLHAAVLVPEMWELLKLGVTGYIVGRSAEKAIPALGDILSTKAK